jgi:glycosyltransferase involved in cell wall biosynthesis
MNFKSKYNLNSGGPLIGTVGRISKEKGHKYFLEASKIVLKDFPDAKFLIVGEGEIRNELERFAEEIGIADSVLFTGYYKNLSEVLAAIDLFVIPSLTESLPLVVLEAMAAGKPVISTDVGGIPEVVIHGKTGLLVGPKRSEEMANSIVLLLKNSDVMFNLAKNGKQLVYDEFSEKGFVGKTENLYSFLDSSKRSLE